MSSKYKNKIKTSPEYEEAKKLNRELKRVYKDIAVIDKVLAEMQVDKAKDELDGNKAGPFWSRWFRVKKDKNNKSFFCESDDSFWREDVFEISETEFVILRAFKQEMIKSLNEKIRELSEKINED